MRTNHFETKYEQVRTTASSLAYLAAAVIFFTILVWGGALLLPVALLILGPVVYFSTRDEESRAVFVERIDNLRHWKKLPQRLQLEKAAESHGLPVMISHRESTAIVYANKTAREWLGQDLVGRTVDSEDVLDFRPLRVNGEPVDKNKHPALIVKNQTEPKAIEVLWATPLGEIPFCFEGKKLLVESGLNDDYLVLTLHPKKSYQAASEACA
ncbi:hypothetical protein D3C87_1521610 [compost metagenome]